MAVARKRAPALISSHEVEYQRIEDWYRDELAVTRPPTGLDWEPIKIGPTWQWGEDSGWLLPRSSLGWRVMAWCGHWLRDRHGQPWQFTMEQARFILWFFALDERARWTYHSAVFQRLKGHGKDPVLAAVSLAMCFGPVRFDHWEGDRPVGDLDPVAWVQLVAVAQTQTKNTMKLMPMLLPTETRDRYGIQLSALNVHGLGNSVHIEAITSNPDTVEGGRPTLIGRNETQNWDSSNSGHKMAEAIEGNAAKSEGGAARMLDVCNAFRPDEDSVAERQRMAWEEAEALGVNIGVMYDSLEAPPEAPLTAAAAPGVVRSIAGDSTWLDTDPDGRIVKSILNTANSPSESRRKWYNQITATADAWVSAEEFDPNYRDEYPTDGDGVVLFFDGSKSGDATALVGTRLSDGLWFPVGVWLPDTRNPVVDRHAVDQRVDQCFEEWDVVGLWADLSDARDDETGERYWEPFADQWAKRYQRKLSRLPAVKTGVNQHLVNWDMRNPMHLKHFTEGAERCLLDIKDGTAFHCCPPPTKKTGLGAVTRQHFLNMRRRPNKFGVAVGKENRDSKKKVDAGVCGIGSRTMYHFYNGQTQKGRAPGSGRVITLQ